MVSLYGARFVFYFKGIIDIQGLGYIIKLEMQRYLGKSFTPSGP